MSDSVAVLRSCRPSRAGRSRGGPDFVRRIGPGRVSPGPVCFAYQRIEITNNEAHTVATDNW